MNEDRFIALKNSVMFNLSLSSKELFHSNFLAYLFKYDNSLFCKIIGVEPFPFNVEREHKNIDIEIIGKNKKYLIENKVKDIIECEQIEKIETNCKYDGYEVFYLFSLLGNNLELIEKKDKLWKEIGYEEIINKLIKHDFHDDYLNKIKNDYCDFTANMIYLIKEQYHECGKYIIHSENTIIAKFREIKLHDLFMKYGMSHFVGFFKKKCTNSIKIQLNINHAKATMTFSKILNGIEYGIETEDADYRRFIIANNLEARKYFENIGWFDKAWKSSSGKNYLQYGGKKYNGATFWYQNGFPDRKIKDISYDDLTKFIIHDINSVSQTT
ncbi:MAG: PD-(D/E)XK nuclease family protein [Spirochaetaceae bacterium]|jgi:hypothetical protein|nr:PD-(D/E)XK nuclease family protein [Spirochaetaceae bacterium]